MALREVGAFLVIVGGSGCFNADVGGATLTCGDDEACPTGLLCAGGLCVDSLDNAAPGVLADTIALEGSPARPGGAFTVAFTTTRPLTAAPVFAGDALVVTLDSSDDDNVRAFGVVGGGARDGARALTVVLTGADAVSGALPLGEVVVDGTPPAVASVEAPSTVQSGATLTVRITATEAIASAQCRFRSTFTGVDIDVDGTVNDVVATCASQPTGAPFSEVILVDVTLEDLAGNTALHENIDSVPIGV